MRIPSLLLRQLYSVGSLVNIDGGFSFEIRNRLSDSTLLRLLHVSVDGRIVPVDQLSVTMGDGAPRPATALSPDAPVPFPLRQRATLRARAGALPDGVHDIAITVETNPFGRLEVTARDSLGPSPRDAGIPYEKDDTRNYSPEIIAARQRFVENWKGTALDHIGHYSFDPARTRGNVENFTGVAQVPLGFAGPLHVKGEHADGEYLIPLATSEGSLVASYSRGMKLLNLAGGVTCTVVADAMQRAPVFAFDSAREARDFRDWLDQHLGEIRTVAEGTSQVAKLLFLDSYLASRFCYVRFNFSTGDAAGQNMVSTATAAACLWIVANRPEIRRWYLESNFATDKKPSAVNMLRGRGKRVTAEATVPRALLTELMRVEPEQLLTHGAIANIGAFMAGAGNNGLHAANGITAMFIACGQDVANVAEGAAGLVFAELTREGDLYMSITLPSLIVGTYGGGTGLPTQRECLEILGCFGKDKARKFAEIVAGVVLAGELSLASAISALEWVDAHERLGRNRTG